MPESWRVCIVLLSQHLGACYLLYWQMYHNLFYSDIYWYVFINTPVHTGHIKPRSHQTSSQLFVTYHWSNIDAMLMFVSLLTLSYVKLVFLTTRLCSYILSSLIYSSMDLYLKLPGVYTRICINVFVLISIV